MTAARLKASILQLAVTGKLVPQDPADEPAGELLKRILAAKASKGGPRSRAAKSAARPEDSGFSGDAPFEIPANWVWCRLGDIAGKITDGEHSTPRRVKHYCGYYLLSARNILDGSIQLSDVDYVDETEFSRISQRCNPREGDLLISCSGSIGRVCIAPKGHFVMVRSAAMIRDPVNSISYLMYVMQSTLVQSQIEDLKKQTAQANLFLGAIASLILPLPPLAEQKRIVAKIEELMPLVEEYGKLEEKRLQLDADLPGALEKAILQDAIQGKLVPHDPAEGTATELLREIQAAKNAKGAKGKSHAKSAKSAKASSVVSVDVVPPDDQPFEIPSSWAWCKLGDVSEVIRGSGIKRSETTSSGIPCIRYGEIYTTYGFSFREAKSFTSKNVADKCAIARRGDVLCTLTGECKEEIAKTTTYLGEVDLAVGGDLAKISKHPYEPLLLVYFMFSPFMLAQKADKSNGDIIVHIGKEAIENLLIPLPPLAEQKRIVAKVEQLLAAVRKLKTEADR